MPDATDAHQERPPAPAKWTPSKEDQDDLAAIDAAIARIQKVAPQDPYRLTIPQDEPRYHHSFRAQADQWLVGTPFRRDEHESLQYLTYHFHEPGKETYVLENSWPVEEPRINGNGVRPGPATTGSNTPSGAPKKKISLDAYKKQKTGGTATPERDAVKGGDAPNKQPAVKGPIERVKAESEDILAAVNESEEEVPAVKETALLKNEMKRKREDGETSKPEKETEGPSQPPAKKAKPSQEEKPTNGPTQERKPQEKELQKPAQSTVDEQQNESGLPPRLSPGMMPRMLSPLQTAQDSKSPNREGAEDESLLPTRLSPTLPENIENTILNRAQLSGSSAPNSASKEKHDMLTPVKKTADGITKRKSPAPRNGFRANSSSPAVRSDAEDRVRPKGTTARARTPEQSQKDEGVVEKVTTSKSLDPKKPSLLVKIKYKKARKGDIQRILKMPPRADKSMSQPPESKPVEDAKPSAKAVERRNGERKDSGPVKGVAQKIGPIKKDKKPLSQPVEKEKEKERQEKQTEKVEKVDKPAEKPQEKQTEKRPLPNDERTSSPTKRRKPESSETQKEPSTPAQREVDSPMAPKSALQATPSTKKDVLSHAMRREQSQDSNTTHNTPPALSSTPSNGNNQPNGVAKASSSQPSNKTPKQQVWETEQKRLETLGRELKHAASAHLKDSPSGNDQKLAAVKSIESFLCYLLAFSCMDEANLSADPKQSPSIATWRSLQGFYGFVKRNTGGFPVLSGLACSLGVVYTARILDIAAQFPNDGPSRASILETHATLQRAANEAEMKLDIDALQDIFPKSWGKRSRKHNASEKLEPSKLGGAFKLPIGLATTPVRAARAGHAMLQEWLERERIDYTLKLKL